MNEAHRHLENLIAVLEPNGIENQEKEGQRRLNYQDFLPINGSTQIRPQLEALGFKFGPKGDDIFVECSLPEGWTKKMTDHSMWTDLLDAQGRKRGSIFYKAAFYDRSAHMSMERRYTINSYVEKSTDTFEVHVMDGNTSLRCMGSWKRPDYDKCRVHEINARDWLRSQFVHYDDPFAHW